MFNPELEDFATAEPQLTKHDFVNSLSQELLGTKFWTSEGHTIYPCSVKQQGSNELLIEMADGTNFVLKVEEVKHGRVK